MFNFVRNGTTEREFFIGNQLVRIHFIIVMIKWTGLASREFETVPHTLVNTPASQLPEGGRERERESARARVAEREIESAHIRLATR